MENFEQKEAVSFEKFSILFDGVMQSKNIKETDKIKCDRIKLYNKYRFVLHQQYSKHNIAYYNRYVALIHTYFSCLTSNEDMDKFFDLDAKLGLTPQRIKPNKK